MQMRRRNDQDSAEGMQEMKEEGGGQENLKGQTETTRWTEDERRSSGVPSEKVWWREREKKEGSKDRNKVRQTGEKRQRKSLRKRGGVCV